MVSNPNTKKIGISGTMYIIIKTLILFLAFAVGVRFLAPNAKIVQDAYAFIMKGFWVGLFYRALIMVGYVVLQGYLTFYHVLDTPLRKRRLDQFTLVEQLRERHNDSHAIVLGGIMISGLLIALTNASDPTMYVFFVLTKGVVGELLGDVFALLMARFLFGVRSMDEFRDWVTEKYNNSHVILVVIVKLVWLALALGVGK